MQSAAVFVALIAAASATVVYRVPSQDSAVINSQRLGGNFAYNVVEGQAYGVQTPVVSYVANPVQTTYSQVGSSGIVQTVQGVNGQKLTYQAQAVPVSQTYGQVVRSPVVANTYTYPQYQSVVAAGTPANTYKTYAGVSPINYGSVYGTGYGYQYGNAVVV